MTYPKLIKKDLNSNSFEYDGGDLWVREDVSFWDDQEVCWDKDILNFIKEIDLIKKFLWKINYTIPYGNQIDSLMLQLLICNLNHYLNRHVCLSMVSCMRSSVTKN